MPVDFRKTKRRRAAAIAARRAEALRDNESPCFAGPAAARAREAEFRAAARRARVLARAPTEPAGADELAAANAARAAGLAAALPAAGGTSTVAAEPAAALPAADSLPILGRRPSSPDEGHHGAWAFDG